MYNTGVSDFLAAASSPNRTIDTKVTLKQPGGSISLNTDDIVSYKLIYASTAGKYFTPGNFVATPLELSLNASSPTVAGIGFKTLVLNSLSVHAGVSCGQMQYVPMGVFYLDDDGVSDDGEGIITVRASDIPPSLRDTFSSANMGLPCTLQEALSHVSSMVGITIHASTDDFPNLTSVTLSQTFELTATYREVIRYIAESIGAYACMGRDGDIYLKRVSGDTANLGCTLDDAYLFSVTQQEGTVKPFQHISIKAETADVGVSAEVSGVSTDKEYSIIKNPLTYGHPEDFLPGLIKPTAFTAFHPAKLTFHGRPDIDTGDVLQYVYKDSTYTLPVCMHTFEYNGGFKTTIEAIGTDSLAVSNNKSNTQAETDITALRQSINALVRDLTKTQSEITDINGDIVKLNSILQTAELLQSQISKVEGDISKLSALNQTAEQLRIDIQTVSQSLSDTAESVNNNQATLLTYFDFQSDGLTIGVSTSKVKLRVSNDRIQFLKDGAEVAYLTEGKLYVTDAQFLNTLILGNFEFAPRSNGNLSLRRR